MTDGTVWVPVRLVGTPEVKPTSGGKLAVALRTNVEGVPGWHNYFVEKLESLGVEASFRIKPSEYLSSDEINLQCEDADLESAVESIDIALEYANREYEALDLPELKRKAAEAGDLERERVEKQNALDARAANLAKPDLPRTGRTTRNW